MIWTSSMHAHVGFIWTFSQTICVVFHLMISKKILAWWCQFIKERPLTCCSNSRHNWIFILFHLQSAFVTFWLCLTRHILFWDCLYSVLSPLQYLFMYISQSLKLHCAIVDLSNSICFCRQSLFLIFICKDLKLKCCRCQYFSQQQKELKMMTNVMETS